MVGDKSARTGLRSRPKALELSLAVRRIVALLTLSACVVPASALASPPEELNSRLDQLASAPLRSAGPAEQARAVSLVAEGPGSLMRDGGRLVVDILVSGSARERAAGIEAAGGRVTGIDPADGRLNASVAEADLRAVAAAPGVVSVTEELVPLVAGADASGTSAINTCNPGVVSEGDVQLGAANARSQFGVDGTGVKVGVLSDSFNTSADAAILKHAADDVASGDLPGPGNPCGRATPVQVLDDTRDPALSADEGRAMTQIVHDLAPGADLAFATASAGEPRFASNIRALAAAGARVIVDDVSYFDEPFYQDGIVANAINDVTGQGVAYFSSAGNNNRYIGGNPSNSWEAPAYRNAGACPAIVGGGSCMDFDPGPGVDNTFNLTSAGQPTTGTRTWRFVLQWGEPMQGVTDNFDLFVVNSATGAVFDSTEVNQTSGRPFEFVSLNPANTTPGNYGLIIRRTSGTGTPRLKWINVDNGAGVTTGLEYPVSSGGDVVGPTIFGHNGAANAQSVAAIPFNTNTTPESFTSHGPVTQLFGPVNGVTPAGSDVQVRNEPDITATDRGINSFFPVPCGPCRFAGTSAAAPHAAAVAALQLDVNPALPAAQVKAAQIATATPFAAFGSTIGGAGLLRAPAAVDASRDTIVPTVSLLTKPKKKLKSKRRRVKASVTFTSDDPGAVFRCAVDKRAFAPCSSPFTTKVKAKPRKGAKHAINVQAIDVAGNVSPRARAQFKAVLKKGKR
jgi:subtilase family protein